MNKLNNYLILTLFFLFGMSSILNAACLDQARLTGINMAGAEFNSSRLPGVINKDYTYPADADLSYIAAAGANVIRLPFRWERLQAVPFTPLNPAELSRLKATVAAAKAKNLCVILDVHNYAKYFGVALLGDESLQTAFVDLWLRIAAEFTDSTATAFGLMNEPKYMAIGEWAKLAKRTLVELRKAQSPNLVLIAGGNWSGLHDWFVVRDGHSNATAFQDLNDPLNRSVLEVHQYADQNFSGTGTECRAADQFNERFTNIIQWAKTNGQQLFLGEFGMPPTADCLNTLERFLSLMEADVWRGWTYWAGGRWWGNYPMALNTSTDSPSAQWSILKKYFFVASKASVAPPLPPGQGLK